MNFTLDWSHRINEVHAWCILGDFTCRRQRHQLTLGLANERDNASNRNRSHFRWAHVCRSWCTPLVHEHKAVYELSISILIDSTMCRYPARMRLCLLLKSSSSTSFKKSSTNNEYAACQLRFDQFSSTLYSIPFIRNSMHLVTLIYNDRFQFKKM
jgi:hypothetical protein